MSIHVPEVDGPIRGRDRARLAQKHHAFFAQRFVCGAQIVHAKRNFHGFRQRGCIGVAADSGPASRFRIAAALIEAPA